MKNVVFSLFVLIGLLIGSAPSFAQVKLSDDPAQFVTDIKTAFISSKNPQIMQTGSSFEAIWTSGGITEAQKKKIIKITQTLQRKKYKINPHFNHFIGSINAGVSNQLATGQQLDSLLYVSERVIDNHTQKQVEIYLNTILDFLSKKALFYSSYNHVKLVSGSFGFGYGESFEDTPVEVVKADTAKNNPATTDPFSDWDTPAETAVENWDTGFETEPSANITPQAPVQPVPDVEIPTIQGPYIKLKNAEILIGTKFDSTNVSQTNGYLLIIPRVFSGENGKTNWNSTGLLNVSCSLKKYVFNVTKPELIAIGASLNYPAKIDKAVEGVYQYKSVKRKDSLDYLFPRFASFYGGVSVKEIGEDLIYTGGFSLIGKKIYSTSLDDSRAKIEVISGGIKKFMAISNQFELGNKDINSPLVAIVIYQNQDSIIHPGISLNYHKSEKRLKLITQNTGFKQTPFVDTYHKMEILAEMLRWDLNSANIDFTMISGRSESPAKFSSNEYFDEAFFDRLKGIYNFHPLQMAIIYSKNSKKKEFFADDMSRENKLNPATVRSAMREIGKLGFIDYDKDKGSVKISPKGWHYFVSKSGKKDYDQINILSKETNLANGTLNTTTNELTIRGVDQFPLSEKLDIYIKPKNKEIKILKNRDFIFDGVLVACNMLVFHGRNLRFDYDSFFVNMQNIDSLKLRVRTNEKDKNGKRIIRDLSSQIESAAGLFYINKTFNKSAKKYYPEYPIFKSYQGSYVYYDDPKIFNGVYGKRAYFEIPPFTIDSLTVYDEPEFDGTFRSDGIFPDIKERLKVMEDLSLGFEHKIPVAGYPVYKNKGRFFKSFKLSNDGIRGTGQLEYLTGKYKGEDFVFYPDSLQAVGTFAEVKESNLNKAFFPDAVVGQYDMRWLVRNDSMIVHNVSEPFQMYSGTVQFSGKALITPGGMHGEGTIDTRGSESSSLEISFKQQEYQARGSYFKVLSQDPKKPAVECKNVQLDFNFKLGHAYFNPELIGTASNEFPYLQYKSSMEGGDWDLTKKIISFKKPESDALSSSYFLSVHPEQDSLSINATSAIYEIDKQILTVSGVPYVFSADSKIIPDKNAVIIRENADMDELKNSKLQIDSTNKRYNLYNGSIKVFSRKEFKGEALYNYYNSDSTKFVFKFKNFRFIDVTDPLALKGETDTQESQETEKKSKKREKAKDAKNYHTVANTMIMESDTVRLAPKIIYRGDCQLRADKNALVFEGDVKLDLKAYKGAEQWLKYVNNGDTDDIGINIKDAKSQEGDPLTTGLYIDANTYKMYSTFLSRNNNVNDKKVFVAADNFNFDNSAAVFRIGDPEKMANKKREGNVFSYNDKKEQATYTGKINLFDNMKDFEVNSAVNGEAQIDSGSYKFNTFLSIKMNLPPAALDAMTENIKFIASSFSNEVSFEGKDSLIALKLADVSGNKAAESFIKSNAMENKPLFEFGKNLAECVNFSEVNFKWSQKYSSWFSYGKIGLASVLKKECNYKIDGFVEIKKTPNGDIFYAYLEPSPGNWYFFTFEQNKLAVVSTDTKFNDLINAKSKGEQTKGRFYFIVADQLEKSLFLKDFYKNYLGQEYKEEIIQEAPPEEAPAEEEPKKKSEEGF